MWIKVLKDWDWRERPSALVAYKKGKVHNVTKRAAEEGIAAGAFEATSAPKRGEAGDDKKPRKARADGQNRLPTEADLGEAEAPAGSAAGGPSATPPGGAT